MKAKTLLALLLLVHLLAHPAMHAFVSWDAARTEPTAVSAGGDDESRARPDGPTCYLCRTATALFAPTTTHIISLAELTEAPWAAPDAGPQVACQTILPARAPPAL
jgi:hypothetical protein